MSDDSFRHFRCPFIDFLLPLKTPANIFRRYHIILSLYTAFHSNQAAQLKSGSKIQFWIKVNYISFESLSAKRELMISFLDRHRAVFVYFNEDRLSQPKDK